MNRKSCLHSMCLPPNTCTEKQHSRFLWLFRGCPAAWERGCRALGLLGARRDGHPLGAALRCPAGWRPRRGSRVLLSPAEVGLELRLASCARWVTGSSRTGGRGILCRVKSFLDCFDVSRISLGLPRFGISKIQNSEGGQFSHAGRFWPGKWFLLFFIHKKIMLMLIH